MYNIVEAITRRLVAARKRAGLSAKQTDRRLELPEGTVSNFEAGTFEISLYAFLVLCRAYDISPTWALTGVNPFVDVGEIVLLEHSAQAARDDLDKFVELLKTMPSNAEYEAMIAESD